MAWLQILQAVMPAALGLIGDLVSKHKGDTAAVIREIEQIRDHSRTWTNARDAMQDELAQQKKAGDQP